jgi:N-glycosylase/DNA lyase
LGYRAKNLLRAARQVAEGAIDLAAIAELPDRGAHVALCELGGVGPKVANCVLLFAYERLGAFPIDVWIERVLRLLYFAGKRRVTTERLRTFAGKYFGAYGGYAQQYLFHHARTVRLGK